MWRFKMAINCILGKSVAYKLGIGQDEAGRLVVNGTEGSIFYGNAIYASGFSDVVVGGKSYEKGELNKESGK